MRFSIRHKILSVLGVLLIAAIGLYTVLASRIFIEQKTALLYDLNHSIAVNTAAQLRASIMQVASQLRLHALSQIISRKSQFRLPKNYLTEHKIESAQLYEKKDGKLIPFGNHVQPTREIASLLNSDTLQLQAADSRGEFFWISTPIPLNIGSQTRNFVALGKLKGEVLNQMVQSASLFQSYLMTETGDVLVTADHNTLSVPRKLASYPLLKSALAQKGKSGVSSFEYGNEQWYGAFAPVNVGNLLFFSQANRTEVTGAITTLVKRSLLFGIIVITVTFIASILFSKRLTQNLQTLTFGAKRIENGDLNSKIQVNSRDEIAELAQSFNSMMDSLRAGREKIEHYNRELEEKVAMRTKQLRETNAAIKEVQEKLLKTSQLAAVGEVAGRTAHELLNPLTAISSRLERSYQMVAAPSSGANLPVQFQEILTAWETDYQKGGMENLANALKVPSSVQPDISLFEEDLNNLKKLAAFWKQQTGIVTEDLTFVREQSERIHRIVDGMREMSRSSTKEAVDCAGALNEAVLTMQDFLTKQNVDLQVNLQVQHATAQLNRDEFIQIVTNLIRNAYQAVNTTGETQAQIQIHSSLHKDFMYVDIIDNGSGVTAENVGKIFDQGFTTKPPEEGTGLGLAICRRYARAFGGEVELFYSEPQGKGTCFRVSIPTTDGQTISVAS